MPDFPPQDATENYKKLISFYFEIKELVAAAEREDGEQRISVSAISELRSAFDHIMRSHAAQYAIVSSEEIEKTTGLTTEKYCSKNFDKAYAHLYRAGYDAYDCIAISLSDKINKILDSVSRKALHTVIPSATSKIIKPYDEAKKLFTAAKVQKDVESKDQEKKQFEVYEQANKQLCDIKTFLNDHEGDMIDFDIEESKKTKEQRNFVIKVAAISGICSLIVGYIIRALIS